MTLLISVPLYCDNVDGYSSVRMHAVCSSVIIDVMKESIRIYDDRKKEGELYVDFDL